MVTQSRSQELDNPPVWSLLMSGKEILMPLYSYTADLAPKVESGDKRQTYRTKRTNRPKVGQKAHNYTGSYSAKRKHLGSPKIRMVIDARITDRGITMFCGSPGEFTTTDEFGLNMEARTDGFENWPQMRDWFSAAHGLPVELDLIKW